MVFRVLSGSLLAACIALCGAGSAGAQDFFPWSHGYGETIDRDAMLRPREVVRVLYRRYGMARVLDLRVLGDVYQANAVDRRGMRVVLTVDAYTGEILERRSAGYENGEMLPRPPREVPGAAPLPRWPGERARPRELPPDAGPLRPQHRERVAPAPRSAPSGARKPEPSGPAGERRPPMAEPAEPPAQAPAAPPAVPDTAARPPAREPHTEPPKAAPVSPPALAPAPAPAPPPPDAQEAAPAQRTPEPLIDPKTGKPNPAAQQETVPPAPMDDTKKPAAETPMVPPAPFD